MDRQYPLVARPSYVSLIPGGPQDFPEDPKLEEYRQRQQRIRDRALGIQRSKRRPREET